MACLELSLHTKIWVGNFIRRNCWPATRATCELCELDDGGERSGVFPRHGACFEFRTDDANRKLRINRRTSTHKRPRVRDTFRVRLRAEGYSLRQLAKVAGCSEGAIRNYEIVGKVPGEAHWILDDGRVSIRRLVQMVRKARKPQA
jgi:hypothetical protein